MLDRVIRRVTVIKELNVHNKRSQPTSSTPLNSHLLAKESNTSSFVATMGRYFNNLATEHSNQTSNKYSGSTEKNTYTLGISIVQGSDGNVYVKDIVPAGPGDKSGIKIGDQILAVDGISLLNVQYDDAITILQNTKQQCELIISQIVSVAGGGGCERRRQQPQLHRQYAVDLLSPIKSKSINNLNEKNLQVVSDGLELVNNVQQLYRSPYRSPAEQYACQQADEMDSVVEEKCLDEDEIDSTLKLKKMDSLKYFHRYPMGHLTPSKSMPEIAGVNIVNYFFSSLHLFRFYN